MHNQSGCNSIESHVNSRSFQAHFEQISINIVRYLDVKPGEHVLLFGGIHQYDFLNRISFHIMRSGGTPDIALRCDEMMHRMALELPEEYLDRKATRHDRYMASLFDAALNIESLIDKSLFSDISAERMNLGTEKFKQLSDIAKARKRREIYMAWPTAQTAKNCNMEPAEFEKLFLDSLMVDIHDMTKRGRKLRSVLKEGGTIKITSPLGSDLTFILDPYRRVMIDTGCFTHAMVERGDITKNLPCGEVYTTPVEDTVQGIAVFDEVHIDGQAIEKLSLEFSEGKLVNAKAEKGIELFNQHYNNAIGDKNKIGELGIGINPVLLQPIGHSLLDEKIFGSIHLALGENRNYGGKNNATIHWDLVMLKPTLLLNDKSIISEGNFTV